LSEFSDNFSSGRRDLSCTSLIKHGKAAPLWQGDVLCASKKSRERNPRIEAEGCNRASTSPWSSSIVLVNKKDKSTRFCVDYHKLNVTHKDFYPLPHIDVN
jgi:hypothetical protein